MHRVFVNRPCNRAQGYAQPEAWVFDHVLPAYCGDRRIMNGHRWLVFRCGDLDCSALLFVRGDVPLTPVRY